jgi:hypothetical protein
VALHHHGDCDRKQYVVRSIGGSIGERFLAGNVAYDMSRDAADIDITLITVGMKKQRWGVGEQQSVPRIKLSFNIFPEIHGICELLCALVKSHTSDNTG